MFCNTKPSNSEQKKPSKCHSCIGIGSHSLMTSAKVWCIAGSPPLAFKLSTFGGSHPFKSLWMEVICESFLAHLLLLILQSPPRISPHPMHAAAKQNFPDAHCGGAHHHVFIVGPHKRVFGRVLVKFSDLHVFT